MAERADLPYRLIASLKIAKPVAFSGGPQVDLNSPTPMRMVNFRSEHEGRWQFFVTEGLSDEGFRIGASCNTYDWQKPDHWLCRVRIHDAKRNLTYDYHGREYIITDFNGQELPEDFLDTARKMRAFVDMLVVDAKPL